MLKILIIIISLVVIIKINHWAEKKKWENFKNLPKNNVAVEQAYYTSTVYYAYNINK